MADHTVNLNPSFFNPHVWRRCSSLSARNLLSVVDLSDNFLKRDCLFRQVMTTRSLFCINISFYYNNRMSSSKKLNVEPNLSSASDLLVFKRRANVGQLFAQRHSFFLSTSLRKTVKPDKARNHALLCSL